MPAWWGSDSDRADYALSGDRCIPVSLGPNPKAPTPPLPAVLDVLAVRVLAAALLVAAFAVVFLSARGSGRGTRYVPAAIRRVPRFLHRIWLLTTAIIPLAALVLAVAVPQWIYGTVLNLAFPGDSAFQLAALGLFALGAALLIWSSWHLGRFMVVDIAVATDHVLITSGPSAFIRHPTYTGVLLAGLAVALLLLSLPLFVSVLLTLSLARWRALLEEELLASGHGFGVRYREYAARTGRFLPRVTRAPGGRLRAPP